jgi:hypothetical protein
LTVGRQDHCSEALRVKVSCPLVASHHGNRKNLRILTLQSQT